MKKFLKLSFYIVNITAIVLLITVLIGYVLVGILYGYPTEYPGWRYRAIPTMTPIKVSTIIPQSWRFRTDNGWVSIIDSGTNEIVAIQVFEHREINENNSKNIKSWVFNQRVDLDIDNPQKYEVVCGYGANILYRFENAGEFRYCLKLRIGEYDNEDDTDCTVYAGFLFYKDIPQKDLKFIMYSAQYGGKLEGYYPDESIYN